MRTPFTINTFFLVFVATLALRL